MLTTPGSGFYCYHASSLTIYMLGSGAFDRLWIKGTAFIISPAHCRPAAERKEKRIFEKLYRPCTIAQSCRLHL
eukprot:821054-Pelagomonas_calceolata.AAC.8